MGSWGIQESVIWVTLCAEKAYMVNRRPRRYDCKARQHTFKHFHLHAGLTEETLGHASSRI